jgi:methylmalonyl-CoA/ethylmalonyl-CoA epimerase
VEDPGATIEAMRQALVALTARVARLESQLVDVYAHEDEEPSETTTVPGFVCVDHVAMAVPPGELEAHVRAYEALGFTEIHREDVLGTDQVREVILQIGHGPNLVQLLEPLTPESPVAKQIAKNGGRGGMAHVALRVTDIQAAFDALKERGFRIIDAAPRPGSRGTTVFFVHPKTTDAVALGYILEVVQEGSQHG